MTRLGPAFGLLAATLLSFVACGEDEAAPPAAPAITAGSAGTSSQAGAGGAGATAGASGVGGVPGQGGAGGQVVCPEAGPRPQATIDVVQQGTTASVSALFPLVTVPEPGSECVHRNEDACVLETCLRPLPAPPPACVEERTTGVNAGAITVTSGAGTRTLSFDAKAKPPGYPESKGGAIFLGGETVTVAAAGATVAGFQTGLLAPIAITFPTLSSNLVVKRDQGLAFTWNDSAKAPIVLKFEKVDTASNPSARKEIRVTCTFAGTALQGKVPAKALVDLPLGALDFTVTQVSSNVLEAGNWDLTVRVIANQISYGATLE